ncbi:MAG: ABC transporter substrate-binding protein [Chloroflexi bacterium]|nr:ABC transporter substrate-binding protein [Chloroflexota bacterium]
MKLRKEQVYTTLIFLVIVVALIAVGCSQQATPTATPTQAPKAAPTKASAPAAKETKPEAKEAKPVAKEAKPAATEVKPAAKDDKKRVKLSVPYNAISGSQGALWITKESGLFEKYGLDVDVPYIATGPTMVQAMVSGEVNVAQVGGGAVVNANLSGGSVVIVAGIANGLGMSLYAQSNIARVEDLKGKTVGVSRFGTGTDFAARFALKKFGLTPEKDVALLQTGGLPETLAALQAGGIQAGAFGPPTTVKARQMGMHELVNIGDLGVPYIQSSLAMRRDFISKERETAINFMKAILEGIALTKKDKAFATKVVGQYIKTDDQVVLDETYETYLNKLLPKIPYASTEAAQTILDEATQDNPKAKETKPESLIDNSLLKELEDSGFIKKLYGE